MLAIAVMTAPFCVRGGKQDFDEWLSCIAFVVPKKAKAKLGSVRVQRLQDHRRISAR
jgi:hypothetical protein